MFSNALFKESVTGADSQTVSERNPFEFGSETSPPRRKPSTKHFASHHQMRPFRNERRRLRRNRSTQINTTDSARNETRPEGGRYVALLSPESQTTHNDDGDHDGTSSPMKIKNNRNQFTPTKPTHQRKKLSRWNNHHVSNQTPTRKTNTIPLLNSERMVMLNHNLEGDGIELEYRDGSIAITHVMAAHEDMSSEWRKHVLIEDGHTVPVQWKAGWNVHYHPVCDFYATHRFLLSKNRSDSCTVSTVPIPSSSFDSTSASLNEAVNMLKNYNVFSELELLDREMKNLNREIHVVEMNMDYIQNKNRALYRPCTSSCCDESYWNMEEDLRLDLPKRNKTKRNLKFPKGGYQSVDDGSDIHSREVIHYLQERRGSYFTAAFSDPALCRKFRDKVNQKSSQSADETRGVNSKLLDSYTKLFGLEKIGAMSPSIRSIAITKNDKGDVGFFLSQDDGKNYGESNILERIKMRIHLERETFWAIGKHDEQFSSVMNSSRVHRVAFGEFKDDSSWIICTKDGTVVWRNIPLLLEQILKERGESAAAPCEVSLGDSGAYFIRFMNGEIKYCLPCYADEICRRIVDAGARISNILMHPEVMNAIVIRHTKIE